MTQEEAIKISNIVYEAVKDVWDGNLAHLESLKKWAVPDYCKIDDETDFDAWYGLSDEWDLNIWSDCNKLHASLYPVVNGSTVSDGWIEIDKRD